MGQVLQLRPKQNKALPEWMQEGANEKIKDEDSLTLWVERVLGYALEYNKEWTKRLKIGELDRLYWGDHNYADTYVDTDNAIVNNEFARIINQCVPLVRDSSGRLAVTADDPANRLVAKALDYAMMSIEAQDYKTNYIAARDMILFGNGLVFDDWDERSNGGKGGIKSHAVSADLLFWDPLLNSEDLEKSRFVIERIFPDPYEAEMLFGISEDDVDWYAGLNRSGDGPKWDLLAQANGGQLVNLNGKYQSRVRYPERNYPTSAPAIHRVFFRNKEFRQGAYAYFIEGKLFAKPTKNKNPMGFHGWTNYQNLLISGTPWAQGIGYGMASLAYEVDNRHSQAMDHADYYCNPPLAVPESANVDPDKKIRSGVTITGATAEEVNSMHFIQTPGGSSWVMELLQFTVRSMENKAGLTDTQMGKTLEGQVSSRAMGMVHEAASGRIREMVHHIENANQIRGQKRCDLWLNNMGDSAIFSVTGSKGAQAWMHIQKMLHKDYAGVRNNYYFVADVVTGHDPETKAPQGFTSGASTINPRFMVKIHTESSFPATQQQIMNQALELQERGVIDQQATLEVFPMFNGSEIMARMQEAAAAAAKKSPFTQIRVNANVNASADKVGALQSGQNFIDVVAKAVAQQILGGEGGPGGGAPSPKG